MTKLKSDVIFKNQFRAATEPVRDKAKILRTIMGRDEDEDGTRMGRDEDEDRF